jgi:hypothetical protein
MGSIAKQLNLPRLVLTVSFLKTLTVLKAKTNFQNGRQKYIQLLLSKGTFSHSITPLKRPAYIHLHFFPALNRRHKTNTLVLNYKN